VARLVENRIQFPYKRSLGPVFGAFMTGLVQRKILGIRCDGKVLAPPLEWNPENGPSPSRPSSSTAPTPR